MTAPTRAGTTTKAALNGPSLVYFWGPVREHVNRLAVEYSLRLHRSPVWISVPDGESESAPTAQTPARPALKVYRLRSGEDIAALSTDPPTRVDPSTTADPADLVTAVGRYLTFPPAVRSALQALSKLNRPGVLLLTNIDRLPHPGVLTDGQVSKPLLDLMLAREVAVVVTSQELMHAPALPVECAFRVESAPSDAWSDAEIYPGIPVSCCTYCPGSPSGNYATCSPAFRSACPIVVPFTEPAGSVA